MTHLSAHKIKILSKQKTEYQILFRKRTSTYAMRGTQSNAENQILETRKRRKINEIPFYSIEFRIYTYYWLKFQLQTQKN